MNFILKKKLQSLGREYAKPYRGYDFAEAPAIDIENAYMAGAEATYLELTKWVSVEDNLPKQLEDCLFKNENFVYVGYYKNTSFQTFDGSIKDNITHWKKI